MDTSSNFAPYIELINRDLSGRDTWNFKDNLIIKRRLGERPTSNKPYPSAPEPVVNILNDVISYKTDVEISMIMNAPFFAYFIPIGQSTTEMAMRAQRGFDTLLRHFMKYRANKEEAVDCKNARGFSVVKRIRKYCNKLKQVIPAIETVDPKDIIVPVDTADIGQAERLVHVLRGSYRKWKKKEDQGWKNLDKISVNLDEEKPQRNTTQDDNRNSLKVSAKLIGINASDFANDSIIVWEIWHYSNQWDVDHCKDWGITKTGMKCRTYICPDFADYVLYAVPVEEQEASWPFIQHRNEYRTRWYYDSMGIGHTCMDDHLAASFLMKRKLIWSDYSTMPMLEDDGTGDNLATIKWSPGSKLPRGLKMAQMPAPPQHIDFDIDYFKRSASNRVGASMNLMSAQASQGNGIEKTATEVTSQNARESMLSSASTDRFNDADTELFPAIWEDCKKLEVDLPMIKDGKMGMMGTDVYMGDYVIVPAASQKTINPDMQFLKWREAFMFAVQFQQQVPMNIMEELKRGLAMYDPNFAQTLIFDPAKAGPQGQPPIYMMLQQIIQALANNNIIDEQQQKELESVMKLSLETAEKVDTVEQKAKESKASVPVQEENFMP